MAEYDPFFSPPLLEEAVGLVTTHAGFLSAEQRHRLQAVLAPPRTENTYGADFSLLQEMEELLNMARALRQHVMTGNQVAEGIGTREVKEAVSASNTLLSTLIKVHEQVLSFERQRAIEQATIKAIGTLPEESRAQFFSTLEELLESV